MKKIWVVVVLLIFSISLVGASEIWGNKLSIRAKDKYGDFLLGETKEYYYAKISSSIGGSLGGGQIKQSRGTFTVTVKGESRADRERIGVRLNSRADPSYWYFSDTYIRIDQEARVRYNYYTTYNKIYNLGKPNERVKEKTERHYIKDEVTVKYEIWPESRIAKLTFEFYDSDRNETIPYQLTMSASTADYFDYIKCIKINGRNQCVRY